MDLLGPQCDDDDPFKKRCRLHQSAYRANALKVAYDGHGSVLQDGDAAKGLNFYDKYDVFAAVKKRRPKYAKLFYANLLRSEHIPYNMFVPFRTEQGLFASVAKAAFGVNVASVKTIDIEYAPKPRSAYLNDNTSFDAFCDCKDDRGDDFFLGIEVKYTEQGYRMGQKESEFCLDSGSPYHQMTARSRLYQSGVLDSLKTDRFRQLWRNHLLAEALLCGKRSNYRYYQSIVLYPSGNGYISEAVREYEGFLCSERAGTFSAITFEMFFDLIEKDAKSSSVREWVAYLRRRYVPLEN